MIDERLIAGDDHACPTDLDSIAVNDHALAALAADLAPVRVALCGTETLTGELAGVGEDVVTLRVPTLPPQVVYLPMGAIESFSPQ